MNSAQGVITNVFVDIIGDSCEHKFYGVFDLVNEVTKFKRILHLGNQDITFDSSKIFDINQYRPLPTIGIIKETINGKEIPIPNARVSFIDDNVVVDKQSTEYEGERIVVDYCMTDKNGQYIVFIKPGTYTIRIDSSKGSKYFLNQNVDPGLKNQFYYSIDGLIKEKHDDIIMFCETDENMVFGTMVDQNGKPLIDAEIIITQNNSIIVYAITDDNGQYQFVLKDDIYDIRFRADNQSIKVLKGFNFSSKNGFATSLSQQSNLFMQNPSWLLIK
jgi:hypothetical protein